MESCSWYDQEVRRDATGTIRCLRYTLAHTTCQVCLACFPYHPLSSAVWDTEENQLLTAVVFLPGSARSGVLLFEEIQEVVNNFQSSSECRGVHWHAIRNWEALFLTFKTSLGGLLRAIAAIHLCASIRNRTRGVFLIKITSKRSAGASEKNKHW